MPTVIMATDLSPNSLNAAIYAMELYGPERNSFALLHCYDAPLPSESLVMSTKDIERASDEGLSAFKASLVMKLPGRSWRLQCISRQGSVARVVTGFMRDEPAPFVVVMGTQGAGGLQHFLMGSNTGAVIKRTGATVLAVPFEACYKSLRNVLLTDDGGPVRRADLAPLVDMLDRTGAELNVLRMVNEKMRAMAVGEEDSYAEDALHDIPHTYVHRSGDDLWELVLDRIDEDQVDLLVCVHHERGLVERFTRSSTSARLAMRSNVPVLVLQQRVA